MLTHKHNRYMEAVGILIILSAWLFYWEVSKVWDDLGAAYTQRFEYNTAQIDLMHLKLGIESRIGVIEAELLSLDNATNIVNLMNDGMDAKSRLDNSLTTKLVVDLNKECNIMRAAGVHTFLPCNNQYHLINNDVIERFVADIEKLATRISNITINTTRDNNELARINNRTFELVTKMYDIYNAIDRVIRHRKTIYFYIYIMSYIGGTILVAGGKFLKAH